MKRQRMVMAVVLCLSAWPVVQAQPIVDQVRLRALLGVTGQGSISHLAQEALAVLYLGLGLEDFIPEIGAVVDMCAFLAGTGGTVRVDGGGGTVRVDGGGVVLSERPAFFAPGDVIASVGGAPFPTRDLVIVDEFDLDELASILRDGPLDRLHESGLASGERADLLWELVYGGVVERAGGQVDQTPVPHGHLVLYHALASIGTPFWIESVDHHPGADVLTLDLRAFDGQETLVHAMTMQYDDSDNIRDVVGRALRGFQDASINLSWGLTSCALAEAYSAAGTDDPATTEAHTSFVDFIDQTLAESGDAAQILIDLCEALVTGGVVAPHDGQDPMDACIGSDPHQPDYSVLVWTMLAELERGLRMLADRSEWPLDEIGTVSNIAVHASAGNQSLPFPMPPAAFAGIMTVTACTSGSQLEGLPTARFSNAEDFVPHEQVGAAGAWFRAPEAAQLSGVPELGYWGTSFASPFAALATVVPAQPVDHGCP
jgi:hypothetical protein